MGIGLTTPGGGGGGGGGASEQFARMEIGLPGTPFSSPAAPIPATSGVRQICVSWPVVVAAGGKIGDFIVTATALSDDLSISYAEITVASTDGTQMLCVGTSDTVVAPAGDEYTFTVADLSANGNIGDDLALFSHGGSAQVQSTAGGTFVASLYVQVA